MVYFEDRGSVLDAPIDVVWDYILNDHEYHPKAHHASLRDLKWNNMNEITSIATCEVVRGGKWSQMKARITTIAPLARITEELEGPYAGQKMVYLYTPEENKTRIDVFGFTPKEVERETKQTLAKAFKEDVPMLRKFAGKRKNKSK
jgi:hypothetical protein